MNNSKAYAIFKQIESDEYTHEEKAAAIHSVIQMATHNSVSKGDMLAVIRYLLKQNYMEWIKCSDRLPMEGEDVLAYADTNNPAFLRMFIVASHNLTHSKATYWMSLPESPQE